MIALIFAILALSALIYAASFGGVSGRWFALICLSAYALTILAELVGQPWTGAHWPVILVDALCFLAMLTLALTSDRHFTLWIAAFQLNTVITHLVNTVTPEITPALYARASAIWSILILLIGVIGVAIDRRKGLR